MAPKRQETCKVCGAPRAERGQMALCADHLREHNAAAHAKSRAKGATSYIPEYQRIDDYRREAVRQGADELESWWIAMAAEIRFQQHGHSSRWLGPFVAAELAWLKKNAAILAKFDGSIEGVA